MTIPGEAKVPWTCFAISLGNVDLKPPAWDEGLGGMTWGNASQFQKLSGSITIAFQQGKDRLRKRIGGWGSSLGQKDGL